MDSTALIFLCFILLSIVGAILLFNYYKSKRTQHSLVKTDTSKQTTAKVKPGFTAEDPKKAALKFLLSKEEKEFKQKFNQKSLNGEDSSRFVLFILRDYINENLNPKELIKAEAYVSLPLNTEISSTFIEKLKNYQLIDKKGNFSERGFDLLCLLARFIETDFSTFESTEK